MADNVQYAFLISSSFYKWNLPRCTSIWILTNTLFHSAFDKTIRITLLYVKNYLFARARTPAPPHVFFVVHTNGLPVVCLRIVLGQFKRFTNREQPRTRKLWNRGSGISQCCRQSRVVGKAMCSSAGIITGLSRLTLVKTIRVLLAYHAQQRPNDIY
jgi:hypothetical protein